MGRHLSIRLGVAVQVHAVSRPVAVADLSPGERAQLPSAARRQQEWLLGRAALKKLMDGGDTSGVRFPDRCLSLTHAAGRAVAASCRGGQAGLGVDYEGWHTVDPRTARFFLQEHERDGADLLRLWTVKEALYKATPDNGQVAFLDYGVLRPEALYGAAVDRAGRDFRYASAPVGSGWLTVAVCHGPG
ncbi:MAG: hypothetical protein KY438_09875 [Actinobacteria bacterium]|nr:hypothetical protein [Actinomycetota bacterium]